MDNMDDGDEKMFMLSGNGMFCIRINAAIFFQSFSPSRILSLSIYFSYVNVLKMKCSLDQQLNNKFNGIRN